MLRDAGDGGFGAPGGLPPRAAFVQANRAGTANRASTTTVPAATSFRLTDDVRPLEYELRLAIDPKTRSFGGRVNIRVAVAAATRHVVLHARELTTTSVTIDGERADAVVRGMRDGEEPDELVLVPAEELEPGEHTIEIAYNASYSKDLRGLYGGTRDGKAWALTQLETISARAVFPCFDEPRFTTPFSVQVSAPAAHSVVANAPLARKERGLDRFGQPDGFARWVFEPTKPIPTYLVAVAVGEFDSVERRAGALPLRALTLSNKTEQAKAALDAAAWQLEALANYTGVPYPYPKLDVVAAPEMWPGAMENAGLVTFREGLMLLPPDAAPPLVQRMEYIMAHELAHHWFGDLVTVTWWNDHWLKESLADFATLKVLAAKKPTHPWRAILFPKSRVMSLDARGKVGALRAPVETPSEARKVTFLREVKGMYVLDMLEHGIGAPAFRAATRAYLQKHSFKSAAAPDFFAELGPDAARVATSFAEHEGVPLVSVDWSCEGNQARVQLTKSGAPFIVPVCLRSDRDPKPTCTLISQPEAVVTLPNCPTSIQPNAADAGYYRYELSLPGLQALARQPDLDEGERAALIANSWMLARELHRLAPSDVLEVLFNLPLARETSPLVLEELASVLTDARNSLISDDQLPAFEREVARLLRPALTILGEPQTGEPPSRRSARFTVLAALLELGGTAALPAAAERWTTTWLENALRLDPDEAFLALRLSARSAGAVTPEFVAKHIAEKRAQKKPFAETFPLVATLGAPTDEKALIATLEGYLQNKLEAASVGWLAYGASRQPHTRRAMSQWARQNFPALARRVHRHDELTFLVSFSCDEAEVAEWKQLFAEQTMPKNTPGLESELDQARDCASFRQKELPAVSAWLSRRSATLVP